MKWTDNIRQLIEKRLKTILLFCCVLLLVSCGGDDGAESCGTVQDNQNGSCMLCGFFEILTTVAGELADKAWGYLADTLANIVLIVAAIYIAYNTLKMVGNFGKQNVSDYLTSDKGGLLIFMFKATVIYLLLSNTLGDKAFQKYILFPILEASLEISKGLSGNIMSDYVHGNFNIFDAVENQNSWHPIFKQLNETARDFNDSVQSVAGVGQTMACYATVGKIWSWKLLQLVYGGILFAFGWILLAAVSFYLADIIIRLAITATLLPLGIACAISNLSIAYTKNIWNLFLNVFFSFIILGLVLGITTSVIAHCINGSAAPAFNAYIYDLPEAIDANNIAEISAAFQSFGYLLLTVVCLSVMYKLVEQMGKFAGEIAGAAGFSPATAAVAPFAGATAKEIRKGAEWGGKTAMSAAQAVGGGVARATRLNKLYTWSGRNANKLRGILTGTGRYGYRAWWRRNRW